MPYKTEKMRLPVELDRRIKILPADRVTVKKLFAEGMAIRAIGRKYGVDHRTIQFILFPERLLRARENRNWRDYYDRVKHTRKIREHRRYKNRVLTSIKEVVRY